MTAMPPFDYTSGNPDDLVGGGEASMTDIQGPFYDLESYLNSQVTAAVNTLQGRVDALEAAGGSVARIADIALAAPAAGFDFVSIPQTYAHLHVVMSLRTTAAATIADVLFRLNADASNNYHYTRLYGTGAGAFSDNQDSAAYGFAGQCPGALTYAGAYATGELLISDYTNPETLKVVLARTGHRGGTTTPERMLMHVETQWNLAQALNRLQIFQLGGSWAAGSRATLYGLRGA